MFNELYQIAEEKYRVAAQDFLKTERAFQQLDEDELDKLYRQNANLSEDEILACKTEIERRRQIIAEQAAEADARKQAAAIEMKQALARTEMDTDAIAAVQLGTINVGGIVMSRLNLSGISRADGSGTKPVMDKKNGALSSVEINEVREKAATIAAHSTQQEDNVNAGGVRAPGLHLSWTPQTRAAGDPLVISVKHRDIDHSANQIETLNERNPERRTAHSAILKQNNLAFDSCCGCINLRVLGGFMMVLGGGAFVSSFILLHALSAGVFGTATIAVAGFVIGLVGFGFFNSAPESLDCLADSSQSPVLS